MNIISLFSGCGGLDLGFKRANFDVIWANEYDRSIWSTYIRNHPETVLETRSITKIKSSEIPDCIGIIGGPPCQSWSNAGMGLGYSDPRGKLFNEFVRVISAKKPLFFLAENVEGMLSKKHSDSFKKIKKKLEKAGDGYTLSVQVLNAADFGVPQNRKRVIFVGYRKDLGISFEFPAPTKPIKNVRSAIEDLQNTAMPANGTLSNYEQCLIPNHEFWEGSFSYIFMSRNRVLSWDQPSYTIQASARQASLHPQAPKMIKVEKDVMKFDRKNLELYRRLTIRECARIQTFPDDFIFDYQSVDNGYKMVGNAVPVEFAHQLAKKIFSDLNNLKSSKKNKIKWKQNTALKQPELVLV